MLGVSGLQWNVLLVLLLRDYFIIAEEARANIILQ